ncbi:MAG TPA: glycosyltransferase [Oscillospiraceae bacterium]|nr:glycosyltransferase [Oscillospiraceae bacterium]HPS35110.1 glycosyltransferase [Oscillospiraceae bacterium]
MIIALYIMFAISILAPIYTYAIYPVILKLLPARKKFSVDEAFTPLVSVIVRKGGDENATDLKLTNLAKQKYPSDKLEIITTLINGGILELSKAINAANGEIIVISDTETVYESNAVKKLAKHFSDKCIGCVVGQLRKADTGGKEIDGGAFRKYENFVRKQESKLGAVSGANRAIYAFRKDMIKVIPQNIIDVDFYISTFILQAGYDVIMDAEAVAYESDEKPQFERHVHDGMGYYQALGVFWRLLLPRKGSFVYVSHRVMKWLVPYNVIAIFCIGTVLSFLSEVILLSACVIAFSIVIMYLLCLTKKTRNRISICRTFLYFAKLNLAWLLGAYEFCRKSK